MLPYSRGVSKRSNQRLEHNADLTMFGCLVRPYLVGHWKRRCTPLVGRTMIKVTSTLRSVLHDDCILTYRLALLSEWYKQVIEHMPLISELVNTTSLIANNFAVSVFLFPCRLDARFSWSVLNVLISRLSLDRFRVGIHIRNDLHPYYSFFGGFVGANATGNLFIIAEAGPKHNRGVICRMIRQQRQENAAMATFPAAFSACRGLFL